MIMYYVAGLFGFLTDAIGFVFAQNTCIQY